MRSIYTSLLLTALAAVGAGGQQAVRSGPANMVLPPAISRDGGLILFATTMAPDGSETRTVADLYVYSEALAPSPVKALTHLPVEEPIGPPRGVTTLSLAPSGNFAAYSTWTSKGPTEEVHVVNTATGADVKAAVYSEGCIQLACIDCAVACINAVHLSPDAATVLYSAARTEPFYVANADGTGGKRLPVYSGFLAPSAQRVISDGGRVVFASSAPFGPTLAPQATDVYTMTMDGADIRPVTRFGNNASIFSRNATIAANGSLIAFESNFDPDANGPGDTHVWVVRPDGTGLRRLTSGAEPATDPSISGDGAFVVFTRSGQLQVANTLTGAIGNVTNYRYSEVYSPALSGDGASSAYAVGPQNGFRSAIYARDVRTLEEKAIFAPRMLNPRGITSAAAAADPASRSLASLYGVNLVAADRIVTADSFPLPTSLAGLSVLVNGSLAPLLAVTPWQINLQLPELPAGSATFQVQSENDGRSNRVDAAVRNISPAPFARLELSADAKTAYWQAAAFHAGTAAPANLANPAAPGEILEIYATGLGATNPAPAPGAPAPANPPAQTLETPVVLIGETPARVLFSGLTPGLAGVYQVNIEVPANLAPNRYPVLIRVGENAPPAMAEIAVR
jgi:uncharacterized protein (TIGR03437 family)